MSKANSSVLNKLYNIELVLEEVDYNALSLVLINFFHCAIQTCLTCTSFLVTAVYSVQFDLRENRSVFVHLTDLSRGKAL